MPSHKPAQAMKKPPRVDRDRLRERERQARAAMSVQAEQAAAGGGPDTRHHQHHHNHANHHVNIHVSKPLFHAPVRVDPDPQIQSKLGNYSLVKHLLDRPKRLIGIDGIPPSPAPSPTPTAHKSGTDSSVRSCSPSSGQEFKKPGGLRGTSAASSSSSAASSSSSASHQRGGFVKPADGKPPYGGRGGYPGQPVKHGGSSNEHRSHGLLPAKPSQPHSSSSVGNNGVLLPIGNSGGNVGNPGGSGGLASRNQFGERLKLLSIDVKAANSRSSTEATDVENILKEMAVPTPLTAIAQTPRKEHESKFTFNPHLAKLTEVAPPEPPKPQRQHTANRLSAWTDCNWTRHEWEH